MVLGSLGRLPNVGEGGSGSSFSSKLVGAVKMDWETFIESAAKPFGLLESVHQGKS